MISVNKSGRSATKPKTPSIELRESNKGCDVKKKNDEKKLVKGAKTLSKSKI